jgi:EmrB/QacA subfamily drug resistance transporter
LYLDKHCRTLITVNTTGLFKGSTRASNNALLFVVCLAQFMVILDVAVVNVALPSMRTGLHFSTTGLQWVVNAYTITFAGFLMLGGRSADLLGRRRIFVAGTALFALSSLVCALASSRGLLIGARALQGFGGAVVSPATLSIITSSLPEGPERNRGLGFWGAIGGLGASSGALLGGILTQTLGWPAIFAINVPLGVLAIVLAFRVIPGDVKVLGKRNYDVAGALLITSGLVALTFGIVRTDALGWGASGVLEPLALAAVLLGAFVLVEAKISQAPLIPLSIFRLRRLRAANAVVVLMYSALFSMFFFVTLYLQQVLHQDALQAGLSFLPITLSVFTASSLAPRLVARFGVRTVVTAGMLSAATGLLLLADVRPGASYVSAVLPGGMLAGLGMGLGLVPSTIAATQGVPPTQSGLASGLLNTSRLFGGAIGLAVLSTLAASEAHAASHVQGLTNGFALAFQLGAVICLVAAAVAGFELRSQLAAQVAPAPAQAPEDAEPLAA